MPRFQARITMGGVHARANQRGRVGAYTPGPEYDDLDEESKVALVLQEPAAKTFSISRRFEDVNEKTSRRAKTANEQARQKVRKAIGEILLYITFLFFFSVSAILTSQDQDNYWFGANVKGQVAGTEWEIGIEKLYEDIATIKEYHGWLQMSFYNTLWLDVPYTGDAGGSRHPGYIAGVNKIVGGVRISQLRVAERDCDADIVGDFKFLDNANKFKCFGGDRGEFTAATESKADFGNGPRKYTYEGWGDKLQTVEEERAAWYTTVRTGNNREFTAPAFAVNLPNNNATEALRLIKELESATYIDRATRLVVVDFTVFNPMANLWTVHQYHLQIPKVGGCLVTESYWTVRLYTVFESTSFVTTILEIIVILFFMYYIIREILVVRAKEHPWKYLTEASTIAHNANLLFFCIVYLLRVLTLVYTPAASDVIMDSDTYYNFRTAATIRRTATSMNAVNAFLSWFKLVRFMSLIPRFALVTTTLMSAAGGVSGFGIIFLIVFYGFSAAFMISFGRRLFDYRNLTASVYSLLRALLGDFDLEALVDADWVLGILLFATFVCVAVFVVLNVLIAIISDSYADAQKDLQQKEHIPIWPEVIAVFRNAFEKCCPCCVRCCLKGKAKVDSAASAVKHKVEKIHLPGHHASSKSSGAGKSLKITVAQTDMTGSKRNVFEGDESSASAVAEEGDGEVIYNPTDEASSAAANRAVRRSVVDADAAAEAAIADDEGLVDAELESTPGGDMAPDETSMLVAAASVDERSAGRQMKVVPL